MNVRYPLLITSALSPPNGVPFLEMINPIKRLLLTKASIFFWIGIGIKNIVIADSTNSLVLTDAELLDIKAMGVDIEQIKYQQNVNDVINLGKGFAEGKLIQYSLQNSSILNKYESFYKSTAKTLVRNFRDINSLITNNNISNIFWKNLEFIHIERQWIDCKFYLVSHKYAIDNLIPSYLSSNDFVGASEYYIYQTVSKTLETNFSMKPNIFGFSGGSNDLYFDESLGYLDKSCPCWVSFGHTYAQS